MDESMQNAGHKDTAPDAATKRKRYEFACPHCGHVARARSGHTVTPLYRERVYQCQNADCGHVYVVGMEVLRTVSPSATPNPDVHIPLSASARKACRQALEKTTGDTA